MTSVSYLQGHDECVLCESCGTHLYPEIQWPCLACSANLCGTCECPNPHPAEVTC